MRTRCYWLQTSRRFCGVLLDYLTYIQHVHIRLLYDAERDLLARAKFRLMLFRDFTLQYFSP